MGCYTGKVTHARRWKTVTPPNNGARASARAARRSSKNILTDFLKAVLPGLGQEEFEELTIEDPQLKREFGGDKLEILDVKVRTAGGKSIDIEIQISDMPEMRSRISYYLSNMITE
jgi:predicted transposase/invertase (TIGR01784 family)